MSAGSLFQQALRTLGRLELPESAQRDVLGALEAARKKGPLALLYEAGAEAGLARDELFHRALAIFFAFCAGSLADDLIDGDCDYLETPIRVGPSAQYLLQNLSFR